MTEKTIRSFVRRQGRLSPGQKKALERLSPRFSITPDQIPRCFANDNPVTLEIGFGMGDSLVEMAQIAPERNFIGIEVHRPGIGHLLLGVEQAEIDNIRVIEGDSVELLKALSAPCLDRIQVFFPDPWPKKKHHKRRLVNPGFLDLCARVMTKQGLLHVATDWVPYAEEMALVIDAHPRFDITDPPSRVQTKYESRGVRLGHEVRDIAALLVGE